MIIHPLKPREKTQGGIILTEQSRGNESYLEQFGVLVKSGPTAFVDSKTGDNLFDNPPQLGDVVMFMRHAGSGRDFYKEQVVTDGNGNEIVNTEKFILMNDKDIVMTLSDISGYKLG